MNSEFWDSIYSTDDTVWKGPPLQESPFEPGLDILELGCGNGKNIPSLLQTASSLTAVDFSKKALEICRRKFSDSRISFIESDVCNLPFSDATFDATSAIHVLEHLVCDERTKSVNEIFRTLRPDGKVLARVFSTDDMRCGKGSEIEENTFRRGNGIIYHYFVEDELISLFNNFELINIKTHTISKQYGSRSEICAVFRKPTL